MKNVLLISCGSISATEVNFALRASKEYRLFGSSTYKNHGIYVYENYISDLPNMSESDFIPRLNDIIEKYRISFLISGHESMILFLQEHASEIHATIVSSCYETALLCRYKTKTYAALRQFDFVPKTYAVDEVREYPVFMKKDDDQGARHAYKVNNRDELLVYAASGDMVICEFLPGEEVTVDCFTDRHGSLRLCNPRVADRMLAGIDVHARRKMEEREEILRIGEAINSTVKFHGQWFFQVKKDKDGKFKLLEMATRFAGSFGLTKGMDINLPLLALRDFDGKEIEVSYNDLPIEADKQFFNRFETPVSYDTVYLDGEDVFHCRERIDSFFMMFVYQCVDKGKKLVLLTEKRERTLDALEKMRISASLFDVVCGKKELVPQNAVFISRDESERIRLRKEQGMFCLDPSVIEVLLDWHA